VSSPIWQPSEAGLSTGKMQGSLFVASSRKSPPHPTSTSAPGKLILPNQAFIITISKITQR